MTDMIKLAEIRSGNGVVCCEENFNAVERVISESGRVQQMTQQQPPPVLSSALFAACSCAFPSLLLFLLRFFFRSLSPGGAYGRIERWTMVGVGAGADCGV